VNTDPPGTRGLPAEAPATAKPPHHPGSDNSDTARYQRGLHAYASQFHIPPGQVPAWFANTVGGVQEAHIATACLVNGLAG